MNREELLAAIITNVRANHFDIFEAESLLRYLTDAPPPPEGSNYVWLTQGQVAIVDDDDLERVAQHKWWAAPTGGRVGTFFAKTKIAGKQIYLHHFILGTAPKERIVVDHINHNPLDNRKSNLRTADVFENSQNRRAWSCPKRRAAIHSPFKGVYWAYGKKPVKPHSKPWRSFIKCRGVGYELGYFATDKEAAKAYDVKAIELHGEFSSLNFRQEIDIESKADAL